MTLKNQDNRGEIADAFVPGANAKPRRGNANLKTTLGILFKSALPFSALPYRGVRLVIYMRECSEKHRAWEIPVWKHRV